MGRSPLIPIFLTVFIDLVGFGIVIPVLPYYVRTFGADADTLGLMTASFSLMQFLFSPILGGLSDRIGRKPVLTISLLGTAVASVMMGMAGTVGGLSMLFAARILAGISGATIGTAQAYIADVTPPDKRAAGMGLIGAAFGMGFVLGPTIGGVLSHRFGVTVPFYTVAVVAVLNSILVQVNLKEPEKHQSATADRGSRWRAMSETLREGRGAIPIWIMSLGVVAFANMETTIALLSQDRYGMTPEQTGYLFAYMGILIAIVQGGLIRKLVPRFGEINLTLVGAAITGSALLLIAGVDGLQVLLLALGMVALGQGMLNPSLSSLISKQAPADRQGMVLGVSQAMGSLARIIGPLLGGWLYAKVSKTSPYLVGGMMMLGTSMLTAWYRSRFGEHSSHSK